MSEFDVRKDVATEITSIRFSEDMIDSTTVASTLFKGDDRLHVRDADYGEGNAGYLLVANKEHAENLINALYKAIDLGWLQ